MLEPRTLFEKIWDRHIVSAFSDGRAMVHIDRHVLQETTCAQAFDALRAEERLGGDGKLVGEIARPGETDESVERG